MKDKISIKLDSKAVRLLMEEAHEKNMLIEELIRLLIKKRHQQ